MRLSEFHRVPNFAAMRVALTTLGCKLNATETSAIERRFVDGGHEVVEYGQPADLLVVNTCSVTEQADTECRKIVRKGLRGAPDAKVVVTGCYAQLKPDDVLSIDGVKAVVGTASKLRIADMAMEILAAPQKMRIMEPLTRMTQFTSARSSRVNSRTRAFIKVQDGCDYSCSFCTIPLARGPARAMPLDQLREELIAVVNEGFYECVISGINLGEYESPGGERLIDLLRMIDSMQLPIRVRLGSIEPNTLTSDIIDVVAQSRTIVPHFHIPLQSGSGRILRAMRRRYNPAMYRSVIERLHRALPDAAIGIDVITGFPGETEVEFNETVSLLQSLPWTYLHVFTYSERANTDAASMSDAVDVVVRRERTRRLRDLSDVRTQEFHRSQLGSVRTFLPEGHDPSTRTWTGWTENHVAVRLTGAADMPKRPMRVLLVHEHSGAVDAQVLDDASLQQLYPSLRTGTA
ncbi:MAG: tRNA (N(6)-L-threonylcarbamoyladenosine(37)-C(2))-methylthiotransferase MtaB [Candidatus Kapabacteria bacterium]|nr:tRNA (N(6)-L-threonylcarbamoyladenosine(37)-C(2))-methylthiotransferase MtaB [Candidatus Kapabacteria bacterium]